MMNSFSIVAQFERRIAEFTGAPYAVAVNSGTNAIFLALMYARSTHPEIVSALCPARTFISVPLAIMQSGLKVRFHEYAWHGSYSICLYDSEGWGIDIVVDSALSFHKQMYLGSTKCLSFHARKLLNIGEGGMILTGSQSEAEWLRAARYCGREAEYDFAPEAVTMMGWQMYMTPEKAARGLHLMDYMLDNLPDQVMEYPDLRKAPVFKGAL